MLFHHVKLKWYILFVYYSTDELFRGSNIMATNNGGMGALLHGRDIYPENKSKSEIIDGGCPFTLSDISHIVFPSIF